MAVEDRSQTLAFLYKIIDDNQAIIRFLDTKAAFGIAILGAMISKFLDSEQIIACRSHGLVIEIVSATFAVSLIFSAVLGYKTVFPTINPAENVSFPDNVEPKFFICEFSRKNILGLFSSSKKFSMLKTTHADYVAALKQASAETIEAVVAAEVLKVSFIRELKVIRLHWFARVVTVTVILFMVIMLAIPKAIPDKQVPTLHVPQIPAAQQK